MDQPTPKQRPRKGVRFFIDPALSEEQILDFIDGGKVDSDSELNNEPDDLSDELETHR